MKKRNFIEQYNMNKMENIVTKIKRERGYVYRVDKEGNVIKESYNWFKDRTTLVTITIIILGLLFYLQMNQSVTNANNFEEYCSMYYPLKSEFMIKFPDKEPTLSNIIEYSQNKQLNKNLNLTNG